MRFWRVSGKSGGGVIRNPLTKHGFRFGPVRANTVGMKTLILAATFMMLGEGEEFRRQGYAVYAPVAASGGYFSKDIQGAFVGGDFLFFKGVGANVDAGGYFVPHGGGIGAFSPRKLPQPAAAPWYGKGIDDVVTEPTTGSPSPRSPAGAPAR
mgnify:CR=1 FL=1